MRASLLTVLACMLSSAAANAASIQLLQTGWSTPEATLNIAFSGQDSDGDGALTQPELTAFHATWAAPARDAIVWNLPDIEPDGLLFTGLDDYLFFVRNADFSLVSSSFEGEALASIFDASLFPVDSTVTPPASVPEPSGLTGVGLVALGLWRRRRLAARPRRNGR